MEAIEQEDSENKQGNPRTNGSCPKRKFPPFKQKVPPP